MEYLYADGSLFPLQVNFIELVKDTIESSVELLGIHQRILAARERLADAERAAARSVEGLSGLELAVTHALEQAAGPNERAATRIREAAAQIITTEKTTLESQLKDLTTQSGRDSTEDRARMMAALERLLRQHDLPDAKFGLHLELPGGEHAYRGRILLVTALGLEATLAVDVPTSHRLAHPILVGDVAPGVEVFLDQSGGILHRGGPKAVRLDKYYVTEITFAADRTAIGLRQKPMAACAGLDLTLTALDVSVVELRRVQQDGSLAPEPAQPLPPDQAAQVERLAVALREVAFDLARRRGRLEQAILDGAPVTESDGPVKITHRLISMLAPHVVEMARRGSARGELSLKRALGGGRREEIYISKAELCERLKSLPPVLRTVFEPLELGPVPDGHGEAVTGRIVPPPAPAARQH